jgi:hypothetical protein
MIHSLLNRRTKEKKIQITKMKKTKGGPFDDVRRAIEKRVHFGVEGRAHFLKDNGGKLI